MSDYYSADDREFFNWIVGHRQLQWELSEDNWNRSRHVMYASTLPYMKQGDATRPSDFVRLHMDGEIVAIDPYDAQKVREWSDLMDSIPFSDPREYEYYND